MLDGWARGEDDVLGEKLEFEGRREGGRGHPSFDSQESHCVGPRLYGCENASAGTHRDMLEPGGQGPPPQGPRHCTGRRKAWVTSVKPVLLASKG